jgi:hypothetical protein
MGFLGGGAFTGGSKSGPHYEMEVNKGSTNMGALQKAANDRHDNGYKIGHVYEQDGNTVVIWERVA